MPGHGQVASKSEAPRRVQIYSPGVIIIFSGGEPSIQETHQAYRGKGAVESAELGMWLHLMNLALPVASQ